MAKAQTKRKITMKAQEKFKEWNEKKTPVYNSKGELLELKPDEVFTMVYDYYGDKSGTNKKTWFNPRYYVSNYGNVLSFASKKESPDWLLRSWTESNFNGERKKYEKCGGWFVHCLIYYSFTMSTPEQRDALSKQKIKVGKSGRMEVHHIDSDSRHNWLSNLQGLPEDIHEVLTKIGHPNSKKTKEEQELEIMTMLMDGRLDPLEVPEGEAIVIMDSKETAVNVGTLQFTDRALKDLNKILKAVSDFME